MTIKDMCKYRSVWMGIAILLVMLFHAEFSIDFSLAGRIKRFIYGGVDIFIFASGIGCYHSYLRDNSPLDFLKRRLLRLLPSYILVIVPWITYQLLYTTGLKFSAIIGNLFGIQGFTGNGHEFNWYLMGIFTCYLLTPYLAAFINRHSNKSGVLLVICFLIISIAFWEDHNKIIAMARLPLFIIGMIFAKNRDRMISKKDVALGLCFMIIGFLCLKAACLYANDYLWEYGLYWYPFILITPFCCYLISKATELLNKKRVGTWITSILAKGGEYSFELFLCHLLVFEVAERLDYKNNFIWMLICIFSIIGAVILKKISNLIIKIL